MEQERIGGAEHARSCFVASQAVCKKKLDVIQCCSEQKGLGPGIPSNPHYGIHNLLVRHVYATH